MIKDLIYYWKVLTQKKKMTKRIIYFYPWGKELSNFYRNHSYLSTKVYEFPELLKKLNRPYLSINFKNKKKIELLKGSYEWIDQNFPLDKKKELYEEGKSNLSNFIGKNDSDFKITLEIYHGCNREGELQLQLLNDDNILISKLTFGISKNDIYIGGLQGISPEVNFDILKEATKNIYGQRPQRIILEALYMLKKKSGLSGEVYGILGKYHLYSHPRYNEAKNKAERDNAILNGYDKLWESVGAVKIKGDFYVLPKILERKNMEDIPSKKRSNYRKRYELLDSIEINWEI